MTLLPRSLFGRNLLLIVGLIALGQLITLLVLLQSVQRPRLAEMAANTAAQVQALGVALVNLPPPQRDRYIETLNALDAVEIENDVAPQGDVAAPIMVGYFMRELARHLGNVADVRWQPQPRGVIWIRVPVEDQSYWMQLSGQRIRPHVSGVWLGISLLCGTLAFAGAYAIQRRLNRPLLELAAAAQKVGEGGSPQPLPEEDVPTELAAVSQSFNRMARNLERIDQERAVMLAGISHDLRTPLTKMRLGLAMLNNSGDADLTAAMIRHIEEMDGTIQQFMDFARIDGDEATILSNLNELVTLLAAGFAAQGPVFQLDLQTLPNIELRPVAMRRLLLNLMQNAVNYADVGLAIETRLNDGSIELRVLDRGPGVAADQLERLKQPFTRGTDARAGKPGTGLGLAIVDRIARLHGGEFSLRLRLGGGLAAVVVIPIA